MNRLRSLRLHWGIVACAARAARAMRGLYVVPGGTAIVPTPRAFAALCFLCSAAMLSGGCATNAVTGEQDFMLVSSEEEIDAAKQVHKELLGSPGLYSDDALHAYVERVGRKVAASSDRPEVNYQFFVLNQPEVNALALPNGHIYVTRGLLAFLDSEAELAAVLAHEVAHVAARHSAQLMSSAKVAGTASTILGVIAGAAVGAATGDYNLAMSSMDVASGISGLAGLQVLSDYSREHELEADRFGLSYLAHAGYPAQAMTGVFDALQAVEQFEQTQAESGDKAGFYHFATHPELKDRIDKVGSIAPAGAPDSAAWQADYRTHIDGLLFEPFDQTAPQEHNKDRWVNKEALFRVNLPYGWRIVSSDKESVVLEKPDDKIRNTLRLLPPQKAGDAASFFAGEPLKAKGVHEIRELRHIYHKVPGYSALAEIDTETGPRPAYVAVLFHPQHTILLIGLPEDPERLEKQRFIFEAQANTTQLLTQEEYDRTRKKHIRTALAQPGDTYAKLAADARLGKTGESYLRLLNRQYPQGEPDAGRALKLVVIEP